MDKEKDTIEIKVIISADTTGLDKAIDKAKELSDLLKENERNKGAVSDDKG